MQADELRVDAITCLSILAASGFPGRLLTVDGVQVLASHGIRSILVLCHARRTAPDRLTGGGPELDGRTGWYDMHERSPRCPSNST